MALNAGSVYAILGGKFNPAGFASFDAAMKKSIASAQAGEAAMTRSSTRSAAAAGALGRAAKVGAAAGVVALGAAAVSSAVKAAKFEKKLAELKAVSGATGKQIDVMSKQALDLGQRTELGAVGATKAADALVELSKAGLSVDQIMTGGLKGALQLVAAGGLEAGDAASYMSSALSIFNLKGTDATTVADALAHAANVTKAEVSDFGQALAMGGSAAQTAGLSFQDTIRWLQQIVPAASSGSDAGTSLKTALVQLAKPTEKQAKLTKELGLNFFNSKGEMKSSGQIATMLQDKLGGLTRQQRLQALATLAGTDGFRALNVLYEKGTGTIAKQGEAAKVGAGKMKGTAGAIKTLKAAWESAQITLGREMLPGIAEGAEALAAKLKEMADDGSLQQLGENIGQIVQAFADGLPVAVDALNLFMRAMNAIQTGPNILADLFGGDMAGAADQILGVFTTIIDGAQLMAQAMSHIPGIGKIWKGVADELASVSDSVNSMRERLRATEIQAKVKVILDGEESAEQKIARLKQLKLPPKQQQIVTSGDLTARQKVNALKALQLAPKALKILASDQSAKQKIAALKAIGIPSKIVQIVAQAGSAKAQVMAFRAIVAGVPPQKVAKITAPGALSSAAQVNALSAAIAAVHSKSVTITATTINKIIDQHQLVKLPTLKRKAKGRASGSREAALIGEGKAPEWWVDSATGRAMMTSGPMLADLGPDDYVIPTEERYRGRALGLLAGLAADLGMEGYQRGRGKRGRGKRGGRYVPRKRDPLRLPVEDVEKMRDTARQKWERLSQASKEKDSKGHLTRNARKAKAQVGRAKADYLQRRREASAAKRYAAKIKEQEDLIEIARNDMDLGNKRGDQGLYNKGAGRRRTALKALRALLIAAQGHVPKGSAYWRELQKQIGAQDIELATPDDLSPEDAEMLTAAERKRLDQIDAAVALAELTAGIGDDRSALSALVAFREGVLGRVRRTGNNAFIAQAARDVKSARDELANLTTSGPSADLQAQLDQANRRREIAEEDARLSRGYVSAATSSYLGGVTQNFYSPIPATSSQLDQIGRAATAGISLQGAVIAPRETVDL